MRLTRDINLPSMSPGCKMCLEENNEIKQRWFITAYVNYFQCLPRAKNKSPENDHLCLIVLASLPILQG